MIDSYLHHLSTDPMCALVDFIIVGLLPTILLGVLIIAAALRVLDRLTLTRLSGLLLAAVMYPRSERLWGTYAWVWQVLTTKAYRDATEREYRKAEWFMDGADEDMISPATRNRFAYLSALPWV